MPVVLFAAAYASHVELRLVMPLMLSLAAGCWLHMLVAHVGCIYLVHVLVAAQVGCGIGWLHCDSQDELRLIVPLMRHTG